MAMAGESLEKPQTETFDTWKATAAQRAYAKLHGLPVFAPETGRCFKCKRDIYQKISVERARRELITGCPYCCYSYVE